jgi:hypothetical protein
MNIADLTRLHDATLRAMNVRNYLRRRRQQLEAELANTDAELLQAEMVFGQLQAKCDHEAAPKLPEG